MGLSPWNFDDDGNNTRLNAGGWRLNSSVLGMRRFAVCWHRQEAGLWLRVSLLLFCVSVCTHVCVSVSVCECWLIAVMVMVVVVPLNAKNIRPWLDFPLDKGAKHEGKSAPS